MIKKVILVILVGFITSCATRINKGEYCQFSRGEYISPCIQFKNDNVFNWEISGHLGNSLIGKGIYENKNKKIYLKFRKDSVVYNNNFKVVKSEKTSKDNISLKIKVENEQGNPVPGVSITLSEIPDKEFYSNLEGIEIINSLPENNKGSKIRISALGYKDYSFNYIPNKNSELLVTINKLKSKVISDTSFVYEIIDKSRKQLTLKNSEGQILEFKRTEE